MYKIEDLDKHFTERFEIDSYKKGYPFVTISREPGAGGRTLAEILKKEFDLLTYDDLFRGWKVFDKALCEEVIKDRELHVSLSSLLTEEYPSDLEEVVNDFTQVRSRRYTIYKRIMGLIKLLSDYGKVVLVGRGANFVTHEAPAGVHIRLVAPKDVRINRLMGLRHLDREEARNQAEKQDRDQTHYIKDYFGKDLHKPVYYDAVWNTDRFRSRKSHLLWFLW